MTADPSWNFTGGQGPDPHGLDGDSADFLVPLIEFDPGTLVLTGYQRMNGGTVRADTAVAARFRSLIFPI
jgi:hypothetical protein